MTALLSAKEARQLLKARVLLIQLRMRAQDFGLASDDRLAAYSAGQLAASAELAEAGVFDVLTTLLHHLDVEVARIATEPNAYELARSV